MENINIETTHNVFIDYKAAGISDRLLAYLIDIIIRGVFFWGAFVLGFSVGFNRSETFLAVYFIIVALLVIAYDLYIEIIFHGQSIGKKIMKIRVMMLDGTEPTIVAYLLRWVLALVDVTITMGAAAIISIVASKNGQRLGDMAANTTVVRIKSDFEIGQTIYETIHENYTTVFPEVRKLSDSDINLVKDLVNAYARVDPPENLYNAVILAKEKLEQKMGIQTDQEPYRFLRTIIKDYNNEYGRL
jgi:uncharacterized RDD family membrane protein YckC